jgi:cytochrome c biogenesis protein CcmG/thiol:disulfide interchange protein DsbE
MKISFSTLWCLIPLILLVGLALIFWRGLSLNPEALPSAQINHPMPSFKLTPLTASEHEWNSMTLSGHWSLLNIWASWCESCQDEHAFLLSLAQKSKVPIYGMVYQDSPEDALDVLSRFGNPYKAVGQDVDGHAGIELGVYGVPETFLIDPNGVIRYRHAGALNAAIWEQAFLPRMRSL